MDTQYIQEFVKLAETMNFSAAAKQMHISQSSLSRHMQKLEEELGKPLFIRTTRRMELSDFGRQFLPSALKIDEAVREGMENIREYERNKANVISIGTAHNADLYQVTDSILSFRKAHPDIEIRMVEKNIAALQEDFLHGRLSLVTTAFPEWDIPKTPFIRAGENHLVVLVKKDHYLASYETVPLMHLSGMNLIVPEEGTIFADGIKYVLYREGIRARIIYQGSPNVGKTLLKADMGIMIEECKIAEKLKDDEIVVRPLVPDIRFIYGLEYSLKLNPNEKEFVKYIRKLFPDHSGTAEL